MMKSEPFYLIMKKTNGQIRPVRARKYLDNSIKYGKQLYIYNEDAREFYPTFGNKLGFTRGVLPAHFVLEGCPTPIIFKERKIVELGNSKELIKIDPNGNKVFRTVEYIMKDKDGKVTKHDKDEKLEYVAPSWNIDSSDALYKFKKADFAGGLARAAKKNDGPDPILRGALIGAAIFAGAVLLALALIMNNMGVLKLV